MMWIHGGGFSVGGGLGSGPKYFMDENIILITINNRLGVFGFLSTGDSLIPGNNGLKDVVLGLKWILNSICTFGGDSGRVTVFGGSAGGASAHYLMLSPLSNGLFKQAISQSGNALGAWAYNPKPRTTAVKLATYLKCQTVANQSFEITSQEIVDCFKGLPLRKLNEAQFKFSPRWPPTAVWLEFVPVKEPQSSPSPFLTESPWSIVLNYSFKPVAKPWIVGTTEDEGAPLYAGQILSDQKLVDEVNIKWEELILRPTELDRYLLPEAKSIVAEKIRRFYFGNRTVSRETRLNLTNLFSDVFFNHPVNWGAVQTTLTGHGQAPVYMYQFALSGPVSVSAMKMWGYPLAEEESHGVGHGDDSIMLFSGKGTVHGIGLENIIKPGSEDEAFSKNFVKLWASFAAHVKPSNIWSNFKEVWMPVSKPELENDCHVVLKMWKLDSNPGLLDLGAGLCSLMERIRFWSNIYEDHICLPL